MKNLRLFIIGIIALFALGTSGCCGGGSEVKTENKNYSTTLGNELQDLRDAYDKGIISEKEYKQAREKLLQQRTKEK